MTLECLGIEEHGTMNFSKRSYRLAVIGIQLVFAMLPVMKARPHTCLENSFCMVSNAISVQISESIHQKQEHSICLACVLQSTWQAFQETSFHFNISSQPFSEWQIETSGRFDRNPDLVFSRGPPDYFSSI
jgi:hypothetical protein